MFIQVTDREQGDLRPNLEENYRQDIDYTESDDDGNDDDEEEEEKEDENVDSGTDKTEVKVAEALEKESQKLKSLSKKAIPIYEEYMPTSPPPSPSACRSEDSFKKRSKKSKKRLPTTTTSEDEAESETEFDRKVRYEVRKILNAQKTKKSNARQLADGGPPKKSDEQKKKIKNDEKTAVSNKEVARQVRKKRSEEKKKQKQVESCIKTLKQVAGKLEELIQHQQQHYA